MDIDRLFQLLERLDQSYRQIDADLEAGRIAQARVKLKMLIDAHEGRRFRLDIIDRLMREDSPKRRSVKYMRLSKAQPANFQFRQRQ
jgi:hypothetical protein